MAAPCWATQQEWTCQLLPAEHQITTDSVSGAQTIFVTTDPSTDRNLYFHDQSWLADGSVLVFHSDRRGRNELFGYLEATGQLVCFDQPDSSPLNRVTCSRFSNTIYGVRDGQVVKLNITLPANLKTSTQLTVQQQVIAPLPPNAGLRSSLNENSTGELLSLGYQDAANPDINHIVVFNVNSGQTKPIATVDYPVSHIQFSWTRPDLLMFARTYPEGDRMSLEKSRDGMPNRRLWHVDFSGKAPWPIHDQVPGELVTHECWWTEERLTFCGGHHPHESHLKIYDLNTKRISILGACGWWPKGTAEQITRRAWWHAAGSPDGRWVAADTFHGGISLFDATTGEEHPLTAGHRIFGSKGAHPHVGWAPSSDRVVYASNKRGNVDVVISHLPK